MRIFARINPVICHQREQSLKAGPHVGIHVTAAVDDMDLANFVND